LQTVASTGGPVLTLSNLVQRVLQRNETIQARALEFEINRRKYRAERGVFEPDFFASATREINNRQNNSQQTAAANGQSILHETNNLYESGLEATIPSGARVRLGYTLSDLRNNIPLSPFGGGIITNSQYQSFFGLTLNQPLLKNFGTASSMAGIRLAALSSKIAFQDYRKQLMALVSAAEATYWNLYSAQEQMRFFEESVKTAETILKDNRTRLEAGKGSELEVLEAEAALGLRRTKIEEARQKVVEAVNKVLSLYSELATSGTNLAVRAVDVPQAGPEQENYMAQRLAAFNLNPDVIIQQEKMQQDRIRLGYAKNQRLPELDFKGAYGLNGYGLTPGDSWSFIEHSDYPSWSVGLELRVPLLGGIKSRNELSAAKLQLKSTELTLHALGTEILNGMDTAWRKLQSTRGIIDSYQTSVKYSRSLLDSALARLDAGKIESRKVFEIEADLFEAKNSVVESLVRHQIARLELEVIQGTLLQKRHLELTQDQLERATQKFVKSRQIGDPEYQAALRDMQQLYEAQRVNAANRYPASGR
jgi:outer membrane protein TolC